MEGVDAAGWGMLAGGSFGKRKEGERSWKEEGKENGSGKRKEGGRTLDDADGHGGPGSHEGRERLPVRGLEDAALPVRHVARVQGELEVFVLLQDVEPVREATPPSVSSTLCI